MPLNTFHLGTPATATVANWIAISDAQCDGLSLEGEILYYNDAGELVGTDEVNIPDGGRNNFAGHTGLTGAANSDAVGMAKFVPEALSGGEAAPYYLTVTRYFYDCFGASCNNFLTAFNMPYRPGTDVLMRGALSTKNGEISIIELNNPTLDATTVDISVNDASGAQMGTPDTSVPGMGTRHVIINKVGDSGYLESEGTGAANVQVRNGAISALSLFYKLDAVGGLVYAYAAPFTGSSGELQVSQFNSFIQHTNTPEVSNSTDESIDVDLNYTDVAGTNVFSTAFSVPAYGTWRQDGVTLPIDTFGTVTMQADAEGLVFRNYVSRQGVYTLAFPGQ